MTNADKETCTWVYVLHFSLLNSLHSLHPKLTLQVNNSPASIWRKKERWRKELLRKQVSVWFLTRVFEKWCDGGSDIYYNLDHAVQRNADVTINMTDDAFISIVSPPHISWLWTWYMWIPLIKRFLKPLFSRMANWQDRKHSWPVHISISRYFSSPKLRRRERLRISTADCKYTYLLN